LDGWAARLGGASAKRAQLNWRGRLRWRGGRSGGRRAGNDVPALFAGSGGQWGAAKRQSDKNNNIRPADLMRAKTK